MIKTAIKVAIFLVSTSLVTPCFSMDKDKKEGKTKQTTSEQAKGPSEIDMIQKIQDLKKENAELKAKYEAKIIKYQKYLLNQEKIDTTLNEKFYLLLTKKNQDIDLGTYKSMIDDTDKYLTDNSSTFLPKIAIVKAINKLQGDTFKFALKMSIKPTEQDKLYAEFIEKWGAK